MERKVVKSFEERGKSTHRDACGMRMELRRECAREAGGKCTEMRMEIVPVMVLLCHSSFEARLLRKSNASLQAASRLIPLHVIPAQAGISFDGVILSEVQRSRRI